VDGKGVEKLRRAGVNVEYGILESECRELNKRFFTYHTKQRPYISLKWAQTADGFIASPAPERLLISNGYSNRLVHQWRSEEDAILIGTHTALIDDPELTTRLWPGHSPLRLVIDMDLKIPSSNRIFNKQAPTLIFNTIRHNESGQPAYYQVTQDANLVHQVYHALYQMKVQSVLVEGGARLLQSFIDEGMWDEARIITNTQLILGSAGLPAPVLTGALKIKEMKLQNDLVQIFKPGKNTP
jgi:diaminohydroxyphosphoribosylaminopyrimidine deaminase/5-amino-6-(5-phosphoribosylamino)uracil reductase